MLRWAIIPAMMAASAQAACPVGDDMASGIEIRFGTELRSRYWRDASGAVREEEYSDDGTVAIYEAANGLLETGYAERLDDGSTSPRDGFSYSFPTEDIVPPEPWSGQQGLQTVIGPDGNALETIGFSYQTRGEQPLSIGECSYTAIPINTTYVRPEGASSVEFLYLVELWLPIVVGYSEVGFSEAYVPTSISIIGEEK